ncbi:TPA: type 1 glutamine amidotransferase [Candidatus Poribacteria bacterium]|nr:type 1 glutamine amidotransferase [Candidatus Poribacteria bacterium]HIA69768.1 type 1 glutamine amidotransferase [Candidatus Poribacteria bacterium]HIB98327.1 type 1 glutamine amidotransferase [Candidatus Poribacteria bacterium]HIM11005.1 type 1 glutamine amidotransferase [Candidatus Poribacteria bacterium]HIN29055.1 type 1 glutamine amidotransferase [Candidatus Poribacteria bacterium]
MTCAGQLYANLLLLYVADAEYKILYISDDAAEIPTEEEIRQYDGILWPGCNLTVYHTDDQRVRKMILIVDMAYQVGTPQFGSCWAAQIAIHVAGGEVKPNPKGREMGVARKIHLTPDGKDHPMYYGKPEVFDGFISHDDEIIRLPDGAKWLASNDFTRIQAVSVTYKNGNFWAIQYHPEYDLREMAKLIVARREKLMCEGYFTSDDDVLAYVHDLETIAQDPSRKDLRWKYAIDDDLLDDSIRQIEFMNWLNDQVLS